MPSCIDANACSDRSGASDLTDYRARQATPDGGTPPIARLVVVIDEFAALAKELPDFLKALVGIAQRGRSLGVHLLLATQRPAGVVNDDIRANTNLRLALRLHDKPDAVDVVGDELPAKFPRGVPGRSALRLGPDELVVFQAARCTGPVARRCERRHHRGSSGPTGRTGPIPASIAVRRATASRAASSRSPSRRSSRPPRRSASTRRIVRGSSRCRSRWCRIRSVTVTSSPARATMPTRSRSAWSTIRSTSVGCRSPGDPPTAAWHSSGRSAPGPRRR